MKNLKDIMSESLLDGMDEIVNNCDMKLTGQMVILDAAHDRFFKAVHNGVYTKDFKDCLGQKLQIGDIVVRAKMCFGKFTGFQPGVIVEIFHDEEDRGCASIKCAEYSTYLNKPNDYRWYAECGNVIKLTPTQAKKLYS